LKVPTGFVSIVLVESDVFSITICLDMTTKEKEKEKERLKN
jgi:hypothetical protein